MGIFKKTRKWIFCLVKKEQNIGFLSPFSTNGSGRLKDGKGNGFYDVMYLLFFLDED